MKVTCKVLVSLSHPPFVRLLIIFLGLLVVANNSTAAIKVWDGSAGASWNVSGNWTNNAIPSAGDDLIFPAGAGNKATFNGSLVSLRSITILDSGYSFRGSAITLTGTNGIKSSHASGSNAFLFDITLATNATIECTTAGAALGFSGNITNGGFDLATSGSGLLNFSNSISGAGGFTKLGTGTNRFSGTSGVGNSYTGETLVGAGVLELRKAGTGQAVPGDLIISAGATVRFFAANQTATGSDVTVGGTSAVSGTMDLNDHNTLIHNLSLSAGVVDTGTGILELGGDVTASAVGGISPRLSRINGNLSLGAGSRTFTVANNLLAKPDLAIAAVISGVGTAGLIKVGDGQMELSGANTYAGETIVSNGVLYASSTNALGNTSGGTTLSGGTLILDDVTISNEVLTNNSASSDLEVAAGGVGGWRSSIRLNADLNVFVLTNGTLTLSNAIVGSGSLIKSSPGILILAGSQLNTYSGTTTVKDGSLHLNKSIGQAIPHQLVIGDGVGANHSAEVQVLGNNQILDGSDVSIFSDGRLVVDNPAGEIIGPLTMEQGSIQTVSNCVLTLAGNVTVNAAPGASFINGHLSLGSATRTFTCDSDLSMVADVAGTGGITKLGAFDLLLHASNSFSGLLTISNGHVRVSHPRSLGTTAAGTVVSGTGTLELENNILVIGETLTLSGAGGLDGHVLSSGPVTNIWAGDMTLNSTAAIEVNGGSTLVLSNAISGSGGVNKFGAGVLRYTGGLTNSYTGTTTVAIGTLQLSKAIGINAITGPLVVGDGAGSDTVQLTVGHQIPSTTPVTVNPGGLLDLNGVPEAIGSLSGSGSVALGAGSATFTCGSDNSSTIFSGVINGSGAFSKVGSGVLTLAGTNTFTGQTSIQQGTLRVNGTLLQSPITMQNSAILAGTGVVNQVVSSALGILGPGVGNPGLLTCSNLNLTAVGTSLNLELNGTTPGTDHDQLSIRGTNNLSGCILNVTLNFTPALSNQFVIINNDGADPITGTFSSRPEGAVFILGSELFRISYVGGDGNDVVLTHVGKNIVPRPVLTIQPLGINAVKLLWPATFTDFVVQTNSNLATSNWSFSNQPQFLEGTNIVATNIVTTPQMFFRLIRD